MRTVVVATSHEIPDRHPLTLVAGDEVTVGERDTEWPAFVFVTAVAGSGWVPARHLSGTRGRTLVLEGYDTTELPTTEGEVLEVVAEDLQSGWLWCRSGGGTQGWVPASTLAELDC